jgi:DNA-binding NarL/FixJ family response regulator
MGTRVLLIGQGVFRDGLARLLMQDPAVTIFGAAATWAEAQTLMRESLPDVLIVDRMVASLQPADLFAWSGARASNLKVIYLTLAENKMVVYEQHKVADVSASDLLSAIRA